MHDYQARALQQQRLRDDTVPQAHLIDTSRYGADVSLAYKTAGLLDVDEVRIVELDACALAEDIRERRLSSVQVITAYIKAAAICQQTTNCVTWLLHKEALAQAAALDKHLDDTGSVRGPLHGVPISLKDFIRVNGVPQSSAFLARAGTIPSEDADIVTILRAAGAVFYVKTTQPQSIMHLETSSFLGVTTNPFNRALTCGGSSGGEGALVGGHGSPMGVTTDIGGSTRGPAANNGLWGYKASSKRLPTHGFHGVMPGNEAIVGAAGPVARSLRDLELFTRTVLAAQPWELDTSMPPMPWTPYQLGRTLRIGVVRDDGLVRPVAAIADALDAAVVRLRDLGVEVVDFASPDHASHWDLLLKLYYLDGGKRLDKALAGEPKLPLTEWITQSATEVDIETMWDLVALRDSMRDKYHQLMRDQQLDALLTPVGPTPAPLIGTAKYWRYTSIFNILDWPAAVFPTGRRVTLTDRVESFEPRNQDEAAIHSQYTSKTFVNAPIALQVATRRWEDEKLFAVLAKVNGVLPL